MTEIYKVMNGAVNLNKKLGLEPAACFLKVICVSSPHGNESELFLNVYEPMKYFSKIITVLLASAFENPVWDK